MEISVHLLVEKLDHIVTILSGRKRCEIGDECPRYSVLPRPIDRMVRVERPTIEANVGAKPVQLDMTLRRIVAKLAKRLERSKPELIDVAVMRFDVITDHCWCDDAAL